MNFSSKRERERVRERDREESESRFFALTKIFWTLFAYWKKFLFCHEFLISERKQPKKFYLPLYLYPFFLSRSLFFFHQNHPSFFADWIGSHQNSVWIIFYWEEVIIPFIHSFGLSVQSDIREELSLSLSLSGRRRVVLILDSNIGFEKNRNLLQCKLSLLSSFTLYSFLLFCLLSFFLSMCKKVTHSILDAFIEKERRERGQKEEVNWKGGKHSVNFFFIFNQFLLFICYPHEFVLLFPFSLTLFNPLSFHLILFNSPLSSLITI